MFADLFRDERAIEGLPIRLVIALVVGVASLSVMMNTIDGLDGMSVAELDAVPEPEVVQAGPTDLQVTVVDPDGAPVAGATVILESGTAAIEGVHTGTSGPNGTVGFEIAPALGPNQADGRLELTIKPPPTGGYVDRRANTAVLVVAAEPRR